MSEKGPGRSRSWTKAAPLARKTERYRAFAPLDGKSGRALPLRAAPEDGGLGSPRALRQQLQSRMQRVGSSFSTAQREPGENRAASRCPSVALAERNQVATLPVRLLRDDLAAVQGNGCEEPSFQMKVDAQGFAPEDLVVRIDGQNLTVTGKRQQESNDPARGRYRMEQSVHRQMQLPSTLDPAAMTCSLTPSGYLWLRGQTKCLPPPEAQTGQQSLRLKRGGPKGSKQNSGSVKQDLSSG